MCIHLTDAPPTPGSSGLNMGLKASRWGVRMSREDTGQRGQGGFIDGLWPFHSRRTTEGSTSTLLSYSVVLALGGKGKEERWEIGSKNKVLRQPCKASHFS